MYLSCIESEYMPTKFWNIPIPEHLDLQLEKYLADPKSEYKTKSEFIRDAVRKKLEAEK